VIVAEPAAIPVTTPVVPSMAAIAVFPLVQLPPETVFVRLVVRPTHTEVVPPITDGRAFIVTCVEVLQPLPIV
jgi:hypothetical protein